MPSGRQVASSRRARHKRSRRSGSARGGRDVSVTFGWNIPVSVTLSNYAIGEKDGPPVLPQGHAPQIIAGAIGLIAALSALIGRRAGHHVDRVETNVLEAHLCFAEHAGPGFFKGGPASQRRGVNRYMPVYPQTIFPSSDGWIGVTALTPLQWQELCRMIGLPDLAGDPRFATTDQRLAACDTLDEILAPALARFSTTWLLEEGQRRRIPLAPVPDM